MSFPSVASNGIKDNHFGAASRFTFALCCTITAWTSVTVLAVVLFSGQVVRNPYDILQKEIFGFACAFAMAGAITGFVSMALIGGPSRALGFILTAGITLTASFLALRFMIFYYTAPNTIWGQREWDEASDRLLPCTTLAAVIALLISGLVLASAPLARRMSRIAFGVLIAVTVGILGLWVLPFAISHLTDRAIPYLRWHYGTRLDDALRGASIGAGTGALAGAIVIALISRWLATSKSLGSRSR
jgi:hypothetical protein